VEMMGRILSRDTLAPESEIQILEVLIRWANAELKRTKTPNKPENLQKILLPLIKHVRFPTMNSEEIAGKVVPSNVLSSDQVLDLFAYLTQRELGHARLGPHIAIFSSKAREAGGTNFWNPDDCPDKRVELSNKNLSLTSPIGYLSVNLGVRAKYGWITGRHYWEIRIDLWNGSGNGYNTAGVCLKEAPLTAPHGYPLAAASGQAWVVDLYYLHRISGTLHTTSSYGTSGSQLKTGDVLGFLLDLDVGTLRTYINGIFIGTPYSDLKGKGRLYPVMALGRLSRNIYTTDFRAKMPKV